MDEVLVWLPIVAVLLAPGFLIAFSRRGTAARKLLWLCAAALGFMLGQVPARLYTRGEAMNPFHPDPGVLLIATLIELGTSVALVWLAYAGFCFHTRQRFDKREKT